MNQKNQKTNARGNVQPILCNQFDPKHFSFTELDKKNERSKSQFIAYPRYNYPGSGENSFIFQTPRIKITNYGLPSNKSEYYKDDTKRNFVKVPFDTSQEGCKTLFDMLTKIDKISLKKKKDIFGKHEKLFEYQPIVRKPIETDDLIDDDEDEDKPKKKSVEDKPKYCKMKLNVSYPDQEITTIVFTKNTDKKCPPHERRVQRSVKTATDLQEYLTFGSHVRFIVMVNKLWATKTKKDGSSKRQYGVALKIMQMEIEPRSKMGSMNDVFNKWAFVDDGENEEDINEQNEEGSEDNEEKDDLDGSEDNDADDDTDADGDEDAADDDEDEDEDDGDEDGDEDDDDDGEDGDEGDEDDEDDEVDEDDDEEEEEEKPKKKTQKGKKKAKTARA